MDSDKCQSPMFLSSQGFFVPCGKCPACLKSRKSQWTMRIQHESEYYPASSVFVTLTYRPADVPQVDIPMADGRSIKATTLAKKDYQDFLKRLRKRFATKRLRYYLCGEYGADGHRPHYHAVLFGLTLDDLDTYEVHTLDKHQQPITVLASRVLDQSWGLGYNVVSSAIPERIAYVAGYCTKKLYGDSAEPYYPIYGWKTKKGLVKSDKIAPKGKYGVIAYHRLPPFAHQSKGIGARYLKAHEHQLREEMCCRHGKYRHPLPRYYRDNLGLTKEDFYPFVKERMILKIQDYEASRSQFSTAAYSRRLNKLSVSSFVYNEPACFSVDDFVDRYFPYASQYTSRACVSHIAFRQWVLSSEFYDQVLRCCYSPSFLEFRRRSRVRFNRDLVFKQSLKHGAAYAV